MASLPAPSFAVDPIALAEAERRLGELSELLGDRGDLVRRVFELEQEATCVAIALAPLDLRRLLFQGGEGMRYRIHPVGFGALRGNLAHIAELLVDEDGYRVFHAGDRQASRLSLVHPRLFGDLCAAVGARFHLGLRSLPLELAHLSLPALLAGLHEHDYDIALVAPDGETVAGILPAQRFRRLFERRYEQRIGCPRCGERGCARWLEPTETISVRRYDLDREELCADPQRRVADVCRSRRAAVVGHRGRPLAVLLAADDFGRLLDPDGLRALSATRC
jgi:hypothetical protein